MRARISPVAREGETAPRAMADASTPGGTHPALAGFAARLPATVLEHISTRARRHGTCPLEELRVSGWIGEAEMYRLLAERLGLPHENGADVVPLLPQGRAAPAGTRVLRCLHADGRVRIHLAPRADDLDRLAPPPDLGTDGPRGDLVVSSPEWIAARLGEAGRDDALRDAVHELSLRAPFDSSRQIATAAQGFATAALLAVLGFALVSAPVSSALVIVTLLTVLFSACIGLRLLCALEAEPPRPAPLPATGGADLPVYSVLVALHQEASVVPQLIGALDALRWPRAKLDIVLACEADDAETLDAVRRHGMPPHMRVVEVPPSSPRTKPKALNYALASARGSLLVLYDAEDRPHRNQLLEAWGLFRDGPDELACVQAPLQVDNGHASFLSRGFALEYAVLFRGLLPWLAKRGLPVPLGGTSNHFRTEALKAVGAWDPYNVTEDADLGFRLAREGYRTGIITRPTLEAAPSTFGVWLPQRTRWLKGWAQTWLAQMRRPRVLWRGVGPGGFLVLQLLMLGMVASAVFHPLMLLSLVPFALALADGIVLGPMGTALLVLSLMNVLASYAVFAVLARAVLRGRERWLARGLLWRLPPYWLALGLAGWRALGQLVTDPHRWEKTPHAPKDAAPADDAMPSKGAARGKERTSPLAATGRPPPSPSAS